MVQLRRSTWIIALAGLGVAGVFAAAAYGSQSSQTSFDSDLAAFMMRSDSSLLKIIRNDDGSGDSNHLDEYSLGTSNAALYKYVSAVDKAYKARPAPEAASQQAYIEVVISESETRAVLKDLELDLQPHEESSDYQIYSQEIDVGGKYYSLELMVPAGQR